MDRNVQPKTIRCRRSSGDISMRFLATNKHRSTRMATFYICVYLCSSVVALSGQDWPQFRGNHALTGVATSALPDTLKLLWTYEAGESIESSAAIVNGVVYVGSTNGNL